MELVSKRNKVNIVEYKGQEAVRKDFMLKADYAREKEFYHNYSEKLQVPKVLEAGSDFFIIEYIKAKNFYEILEEQEQNGFDEKPWSLLWEWIANCHSISGKIPSEGNLRNYLWDQTNECVYGIDFEEYHEGDLNEAWANFHVQINEYKPKETQIKKQVTERMPETTRDELLAADMRMKARREKEYPLPLTAVILAGGKSTRMGQDKATVKLDGRTFLEIQVEKMRALGVGEILISRANEVADIYPEKGPLGGMHACFGRAKYTNCLVISIDCPFVDVAFLRELVEEHLSSDYMATITKAKEKDKSEPLIGVYHSCLEDTIEEILQGEKYAVFKLLKQVGYQMISYTGDVEELMNINEPLEIMKNENSSSN